MTWNGPTNKGTQTNEDVVGSGRASRSRHAQRDDQLERARSRSRSRASARPRSGRGATRFVVTDKSPTNGLTVGRGAAKPTHLTAPTFVGRHTWTLKLSTGRWIFATTRAKASQAILVG